MWTNTIGSLLLALAGAAATQVAGRIEADPERPCPGFKPHELCFETARDGIARAETLSAPFYAVILKTAPRCTIIEDERIRAQQLFPRNKVFSTRFDCDGDAEENISYTNVNETFAFLAVHAGATLQQARQRLREVQASGRFPGANIRRMQVRRVHS